MSAQDPNLVQAARRLVGTYFVSLADAQAWLQKNGVNAVPSQKDPRLSQTESGNTQRPAMTQPQGEGAVGQAAVAATQQPQAQPQLSPRQQPRMQAGIEGDPGADKFAADDKYGAGMKQNTNQQGVQSNGDDDPWLIGAAQGGTYDPQIMSKWVQRAKMGDPSAAWVLDQVGYKKGMTPEDWASSRQLTTKQEGFAQGGKWYTDPADSKQMGGMKSYNSPENAMMDQGDPNGGTRFRDLENVQDFQEQPRPDTNDWTDHGQQAMGNAARGGGSFLPNGPDQSAWSNPNQGATQAPALPTSWGNLTDMPNALDTVSQRKPDEDTDRKVADAFKGMRW